MKINDCTFSDWLNRNWEEGNLCPPELDPQTAIYFLCDYLLEDGFYISMPVNAKQGNTELVYAILERHSKKYRK